MSTLRTAIALCAAITIMTAAHATAADHPLEPLSAAELQSAFALVREKFRADEALPDEPLRFPIAVLSEPAKELVLAWKGGRRFPRAAEVHVLHYPSNRSWVALVDLRSKRVRTLRELPAGTQPAVTTEEYVAAADLVHAYEPWQELATRSSRAHLRCLTRRPTSPGSTARSSPRISSG